MIAELNKKSEFLSMTLNTCRELLREADQELNRLTLWLTASGIVSLSAVGILLFKTF